MCFGCVLKVLLWGWYPAWNTSFPPPPPLHFLSSGLTVFGGYSDEKLPWAGWSSSGSIWLCHGSLNRKKITRPEEAFRIRCDTVATKNSKSRWPELYSLLKNTYLGSIITTGKLQKCLGTFLKVHMLLQGWCILKHRCPPPYFDFLKVHMLLMTSCFYKDDVSWNTGALPLILIFLH